MTKKESTSFSLSDEEMALVDQLKEQHGLPSKSAVVRKDLSDLALSQNAGPQREHMRVESAPILEAGDDHVYEFIRSRSLIARSSEICFWLYTSETIVSPLRIELDRVRPQNLKIRFLIQDPNVAVGSARNSINHSIGLLEECAKASPTVEIKWAFYSHAPFFRFSSFTDLTSARVGLMGVYYHDPEKPRRYSGAERNEMIVSDGSSAFAARLLERYQSRFDHAWLEGTAPPQKQITERPTRK